jgi:cytochrome c oxidase assembly protein subunit 15
LLLLTLAVILWGAWVRVTGSGAGCADHWPLCNGEIFPRSPRAETLIELTHRVTSSLAGLLSIAVFWLSRRRFERGHPVRAAAAWSLALMLVEGAIGALLVKKGLVAKDASEARAFVVGLHLCNTFLLLSAQALTYELSREQLAPRLRGHGKTALWLGGSLLLLLLLGASGAVTALGDTLFPAASFDAGVAQDFASDAHFLVRLRVYHPLLAVLIGALIVYVAQQLRAAYSSASVSRWASRVTLLYVLQVGLGSLNLLLLAPALIQLAHLLLADLTFIAVVELGLAALSSAPAALQVSLESAAS